MKKTQQECPAKKVQQMIPNNFRFLSSSFFRSRFAMVLLVLCCASPLAHAADRKVVLRVKPLYPVLAKRMKIAGAVLLNVVVDAGGHVKEANPVMGERVLLEAAKIAVEKWKYEPEERETTEEVELNFPADAE